MRTTRKNYLINPRLQLTLIFGANVLALISVALVYTLNAYSQSQVQYYAFSLNLPPSHAFNAYLAQRDADFGRMCLLLGIGLFVIFNLVALVVSHRIAGPLYRLQHHLQDVAGGKEPTDVKFRKGDLFAELAEACNKLMARMRAGAGR